MNDNKKPNSNKMQGSEPLLIYVGDDNGFWAGFKRDIKQTYKQIKFRDEVLFETNSLKMQNLIVRLITERPKAIYFDLSKYSEEILHIIRVIVRSNAIIKPALFGLVDITTDKKYISQAVLAGLPNIHIKTSEAESIIYDLVCTCFHESLEEHGFAVAKMNDQAAAFFPAKVSAMTANGIRVESDFPIKPGENIMLHTYWSENKILVSPLMRAIDQKSTNLYYNYEYVQNLKFVFVPALSDLIPDSDTLDNDEYARRSKELQEEGEKAQKKIRGWVETNMPHSAPKQIKVLVIDKSQSFYINQPKTDEYPYVIRCQPYLKFPKKELTALNPQLIVFSMEDVPVEELEANEDISYTFNETRTLQYIVKSIKSMENYNPYIIVFNNLGHETKKLQDVLVYPNIISYKESIRPSLVLKMADLLKSKLNIPAPDAQTFILNKDLQQSFAEYEFLIQILACSETDMYFTSDLDLKEGTLLRVNVPTPMFITISKPPKNPKVPGCFYGLINGQGEDGRMDLRKFINAVFFRTLEEKKAIQKAEVEKIKENALAKKQKEEEAAIAAKLEAEEDLKREKLDKEKLLAKQKENAELEKKLDEALIDPPDEGEKE